MADPFAILANSRMDAPGLIGVYQAGRQARVQDMLFQRQMAKEDRAEEADIARQGVMAKLFQPKGTNRRNSTNRSMGAYGLGPSPPQAMPGGAYGAAVPQDMSGSAVGAGMAQGMDPAAAPATAAPPAAVSATPQQLMDPAMLPSRTDGIELNPDALRTLYQIAPETAIQVQNAFYNFGEQEFKAVQRNGEGFAKAAHFLLNLRTADGKEDIEARRAALPAVVAFLQEQGVDGSIFTPEGLAQLDLSDAGLQPYEVLGRSLKDVISDERADRRLSWDIADDEADNARADRNTDNLISTRTTRANRPRLAPRPRAAPSVTPTRIKGEIIAKYRRGETLTPRETEIMNGTAEGRGRGRGRSGGGMPSFQTPEQVDAAKREGRVKRGDKFRLPNGEIGTVD